VAEIRRAVGQQRTRNLERAAEEVRDRRAARHRQELDPAKTLDKAAKPELVVETANLPAAAAAVRDLFKADGGYYEWGIPANVVTSSEGGLPQIVPLTVDAIVNEVHRLRRPVKVTPGGQRTECTLPDRVAKQYLAKKGEWWLPRLTGITTAPLPGEDESIRAVEGFDPETRLFCANVPVLEVPALPTEKQAKEALRTLRATFRTFPFADSRASAGRQARGSRRKQFSGRLDDVGVPPLPLLGAGADARRPATIGIGVR
jgi:putative DNA primase/helicase